LAIGLPNTNENPSDPLKHMPAGHLTDAKSPTEWVAQFWDAVYKLLYRLSGSSHEAEDLTQDTFLRAIGRQGSFKLGTNRRAWLLRIATNAFLDRQRRKKVLKIGTLPGELSDDSPHPSQPMQARELHESLLVAIESLPETARVVFLLRGEQDLSFREIAQIIDVSEETARWHMMQARKALLAKLDGKLD
jgi:RNA polymerase sigma-70 factor (ECF subfamily)